MIPKVYTITPCEKLFLWQTTDGVVGASFHIDTIDVETSLIENAQHRMLFSSDGSLTEFQERFRLKDKDMRLLSSLHFQSGKHSEFLYQNDFRSKAMRLKLTAEESWRVTSSLADRMKLESLKRAVPGLSTEEAIRCLSGGRF